VTGELVPPRGRHHGLQRLVEVPAVEQVGEVVGPRHAVQLLRCAAQLAAQRRHLDRAARGQQLRGVGGLAQVVVRAGPQRADHVLARRSGW
jgi:hypothetical protein